MYKANTNQLINRHKSDVSTKWWVILPGLLVLLGALALLALSGSSLLTSAAKIHIFVVVGLAPLMLGAMGHFIPVLTRTPPSPRDKRPALIMLLAGGIVLTGFRFWFPLVYLAAVVGIAAAGDLLWNSYRRTRQCLGSPHPCVYWYIAAMIVLLLALGLILIGATAPQQWTLTKTLHLHLNLLGFVLLTALGTLQVLLPTAGGFTDPTATARLKRDLPWAVMGVLLFAAGTTLWIPLGVVGVVVWIALIARLLRATVPYRHQILGWHGSAVSLFLAAWGLIITFLLAIWHASQPQSGYTLLITMLCLFFLPLITGALTQLVPVWLDSGFSEEQREPVRKRLGYGSAMRVAGFWIGGVVYALGETTGLWIAGGMLLLFVLQMLMALVRSQR